MEHFAGYGFNKSHSTAYALLAYQTAYLKANYPWHFAAALLTIEAQNTDKLALYLGECRERGIPVLPPDINESQLRFTVEPGKGVRFGLTAIKNVGEGAIESLLEVRRKQGRITSLHALCEDLDLRLVNKRVFESLVKAGAFDSLARASRVRGAAVDVRCGRGCWRRSTRRASTARALQRDRDEGQAQLFGATNDARRRGGAQTGRRFAGGDALDRNRAARLREGDARPLLERPSGRSLRGRAQGVRRAVDRRAGGRAGQRLARRRVGPRRAASRSSPTRASAASSPRCRQLKTRKGDRMAVFTLEDAQGGVEVDRVSRDLSAQRQPDRDRHAGARAAASWSATTSRCGSWRRRLRRSRACASGWRARWRFV